MTVATAKPKGWQRVPEPTAKRGTLLWGIQRAHKTAIQMGNSKTVATKRRCLDLANARAADLERVRIPDGFCEYLDVAQQPWDVLWDRIERSGVVPVTCS